MVPRCRLLQASTTLGILTIHGNAMILLLDASDQRTSVCIRQINLTLYGFQDQLIIDVRQLLHQLCLVRRVLQLIHNVGLLHDGLPLNGTDLLPLDPISLLVVEQDLLLLLGDGVHFGSFLVTDTALSLRILGISIEQLLAQKGMVVASLVLGYLRAGWWQD